MENFGTSPELRKYIAEATKCSICQDYLCTPRILPCGHVYCEACLRDLFQRHLQHNPGSNIVLCPECKTQITIAGSDMTSFPRDYRLDDIVRRINPNIKLKSEGHYGETKVMTVHGHKDIRTAKHSEETATKHTVSSRQNPPGHSEFLYMRTDCEEPDTQMLKTANMPSEENYPHSRNPVLYEHHLVDTTEWVDISAPAETEVKAVDTGTFYSCGSEETPCKYVSAVSDTSVSAVSDTSVSDTDFDSFEKIEYHTIGSLERDHGILQADKTKHIKLSLGVSGITSSADNDILLCEAYGRTIEICNYVRGFPRDSKFVFVKSLPLPDSTICWDLAFCETRKTFYVSDTNTQSVLQYSLDGESRGKIVVGFQGNAGLSLVGDNLLYVTSSNEDKVYLVKLHDSEDVKSAQISTFVSKEASGVDLTSPFYVAATRTRVAVSCVGSYQVHVFDSFAQIVFTYGTGSPGSGPGQLDSPYGVAIDSEGSRVLIADRWNDRIVIVSSEGMLLGCIPITNDDTWLPNAISLDPHGNILVTCEEPFAVVVYNYKFV